LIDNILLLDCRTPEEFAIAKIDGAVLIPMQEIAERLAELEPWRDKPIIVHCHHGVRSLRVTHWLREKGFSFAQSMTGGIEAWSLEVDPSVPRY
jgi:rhodanese-related sulfurtransferase